jgi:protein-tyrosine-phosphatase
MAEGIARKMLDGDVRVESAGTHADTGEPPAANAVKTLRDEFGVDISSHRSRNIHDVNVEDFDYVVPLADTVRDDLKNSFPDLDGKLMRSWKIADPYRGDLNMYQETAAKLEKRMEELTAFLKNRKK